MSDSSQPADYQLVSGLFLRLLALIYLAAFASIGTQIVGLAGVEGILPFAEELQRMEDELAAERYWLHPTLFWLNASDTMLQTVAAAGCVFSVLLLFNILTRISLILLFALYLSLFHAGQIFMNFQWDYLLLESGFLAIFLPSGSRFVVWLYHWLLFRFRFLSGASKLLSQDPTWANLTALNYFFEVQPLPHSGAWYAHQLPEWFLRFGTGAALATELVIPFLMFLPRRVKFFAAGATVLMQVLILLTSNHSYANLLTLVLCLFLFDDRALGRVIPQRAAQWLGRGVASTPLSRPLAKVLLAALAGLIVFVSTVQMWEMFAWRRSPEPLAMLIDQVRAFRIVNKYHVFPTMKTQRIEIIIEGSMDKQTWQAYEFKYKPGDLSRRPEFIVPHHPRLDWMMWFVPMGPVFLPWFESFLHGLLENSPAVVGLLETNPFPGEPPRHLRVSVYRYRFTDPQAREGTGQWWERDYLGPFFPLPRLEAENSG